MAHAKVVLNTASLAQSQSDSHAAFGFTEAASTQKQINNSLDQKASRGKEIMFWEMLSRHQYTVYIYIFFNIFSPSVSFVYVFCINLCSS